MEKILRFELTDNCNLRCSMCWSRSWTHKEMKYDQIKRIILDFKSNSGQTVVLTSREPLLSKSFRSIIELCDAEELDLKILTNGTLITGELAEYIVKSKSVSYLAISLHGNEKVHDSITGVPGSFQMAITGLKRINKYKIENRKKYPEVRITSVISAELFDAIEEIIALASETHSQLRIQHYMWHPEWIKKLHKESLLDIYNIKDDIIEGFSSNCDIDADTVVSQLKQISYQCKKRGIDLQVYPKLVTHEIERWYSHDSVLVFSEASCNHVSDSLRLRANGDVSLCQYIDIPIGNATNQDLKSIISNSRYAEIAEALKKGKLFPICNRCCHVKSKCGSPHSISNAEI